MSQIKVSNQVSGRACVLVDENTMRQLDDHNGPEERYTVTFSKDQVHVRPGGIYSPERRDDGYTVIRDASTNRKKKFGVVHAVDANLMKTARHEHNGGKLGINIMIPDDLPKPQTRSNTKKIAKKAKEMENELTFESLQRSVRIINDWISRNPTASVELDHHKGFITIEHVITGE